MYKHIYIYIYIWIKRVSRVTYVWGYDCVASLIPSWFIAGISIAWWRHQMETFSALLAICVGNSPFPGEFTIQRPVTRSFDVFFDLRLNKRLSKQSWGWWFETPSRPLWHHRNDSGSTDWFLLHEWSVPVIGHTGIACEILFCGITRHLFLEDWQFPGTKGSWASISSTCMQSHWWGIIYYDTLPPGIENSWALGINNRHLHAITLYYMTTCLGSFAPARLSR